MRTAIRREVLRIQSVQFMVIVLTERNGADVVTNWLDEVAYPEVVGTMAGVDTFIIICRSEEEAQRFAESWKNEGINEEDFYERYESAAKWIGYSRNRITS